MDGKKEGKRWSAVVPLLHIKGTGFIFSLSLPHKCSYGLSGAIGVYVCAVVGLYCTCMCVHMCKHVSVHVHVCVCL